MGENFIERLQNFMERKNINDNQMTVAAGLSVGLLGKLKKSGKGMNSSNIEKILHTYPDLNPTWLMTGQGTMLKTEAMQAAPTGEGIPLIPIDAMAGYFAGELTVELSECERFVVPSFRSADFLITVKGDSMVPRYFSGDLVACKRLSLNDIFFQWGKVYILDTDQGALIKKIEQGDTPETITCVSVNTDYKPFQLRREDIYNIAIVMGIIRAE